MDFWSHEVFQFWGLVFTASSQSVLFYPFLSDIFLMTSFFVEFAESSEGLERILWEAGTGKTVCQHVNLLGRLDIKSRAFFL